MKIAVVGNGIAAKAVISELIKHTNHQIVHFYNENLASPCSLNSTAMVSLNGIEKGVSDLGDLIFDSYQLFENDFVHKFQGVEKADQLYLGESAKLKDRFKRLDDIDGKLGVKDYCYLIRPIVFLDHISKSYETSKNYHSHQQFITSLDDLNNFDKKIIACGAFNYHLFKNHFDCENLKKSKVVPGHYLTTNVDLGDKSFVWTISGENLLYRASDHNLMIGGTSQNESENPVLSKDFDELKALYSLFSENIDFNIPDFKDFNIKTGLRLKGKARRPFWGEVSKDTLMINALYKNGWTFAFKSAKDIMKLL